jgi:hypothetical protein
MTTFINMMWMIVLTFITAGYWLSYWTTGTTMDLLFSVGGSAALIVQTVYTFQSLKEEATNEQTSTTT